MKTKLFLSIFLLFLLAGFVFAENSSSGSGGGGGGGGVVSSNNTGGAGGFYTESSDYCEIDKVSCIITLRPDSAFQEEVGGKTHSFLIESIPDYSNAVILIDGNSVSLKSNREAFFDDIKIEEVRIYFPNDATRRYVEFRIRNFENVTAPSGGGGGGSGATNNTSPSNSSGGGSGSSSKCEKFYNCPDGSQVQYCFIHTFYDENGNVVGVGCGCKSNPQSLCTAPSSGGGGGSGGQPILINSSSGGGGDGGSIGANETPIICNGCILGNKCAPVGYRQEGKYCTLNSEFVSQLSADSSCENNFECSTNLCIDNKCVSSGLWQKFIRWLSRLFG
jgi:hypothetical protein